MLITAFSGSDTGITSRVARVVGGVTTIKRLVQRPTAQSLHAVLRGGRSFILGTVLLGGAIIPVHSTKAWDDVVAVDFLSVQGQSVGHAGASAHTLGWAFHTSNAILVTSVGYFDANNDGLSEHHQIGIFNSSGILLFSATVPTGTAGPLVGHWRYVDVSPPVLLAAGMDFTLGGTIGINASDPITYLVSGLTHAAEIGFNEPRSRYNELGGYDELTFPTLTYNVTYDYFGPNFRYIACPSFTQQPISLSLCPTGTPTFSVIVAGSGPLNYQWQIEDGALPGGWRDLADGPLFRNGQQIATVQDSQTATLRYTLFTPDGAPIRSRVRVSNDCGSVTSDVAMVTICLADFNCDGILNSGDFFDFLACFFSPENCTLPMTADFNHDGVITSQDFFDFLAAFFTGC